MPQDDLYWRLDWIGRVVPNPNIPDEPRIEVMLRPLNGFEPSVEAYHLPEEKIDVTVVVLIGVGQLPLLKLGSFWKKGYLQPVRAGEEFQGVAVIAPGEAGRPLSGDALLRVLPKRFHRAPGSMWSHHLVVPVSSSPAGFTLSEIAVPCLELFRFYAGFTTRLVNMIFGERYKWDKRRTASLLPAELLESSNGVAIRVGPGFNGAEAWILARMLVSPLALRAADLVVSSRRANPESSNLGFYPDSDFPFEGRTELSVRGRRVLGGDGIWRFWVFEIVRCSHPFPFEHLAVEMVLPRDDEGKQPPLDNKGGNWRTLERLPEGQKTGQVQSQVAPEKRSSAIEMSETPSQFDWLAGREAEVLPSRSSGRSKAAERPTMVPTERQKFSTSVTATSGDKNTGRAVIAPGESGDDSRPDPETYFNSILQSFGRDYGVTVHFHKCEVPEHAYMPSLVGGHQRGWHLVSSSGNLVRRIYIAEFKLSEVWIATVDFDRSESSQEHGLPFFVQVSGERLTEEQITEVVHHLRRARGVWKQVARRLADPFRMVAVQHIWKTNYKRLAGLYLKCIGKLIEPVVRRREDLT